MNVVVDVGLGNIGSLLNMLHYLGVEARASAKPEDVATASRLLLPGVGAFDAGMERLEKSGLVPALRKRVLQDNVPLLAICLGMQLLGQGSEEGRRAGLGLLPLRAVRFAPTPSLRVPHMGWNECRPTRETSLLHAVQPPRRFYFVHSYHVICDDAECVAGLTSHGTEFVSAVQRGHIYGVQFHAEKSHRCGMELIEQFVRRG